MPFVLACNFGKNQSIQNVYFKTLIFQKVIKLQASKYEILALWIKIAINVFKMFPENRLVCTMKKRPWLLLHYASNNLINQTDFYNFSNMMWTHAQILRASWWSFWYFYRYSSSNFENVISVVLEPKSMFLVPSMTNNGTTTLTPTLRVDLIWENNSLDEFWHFFWKRRYILLTWSVL